VVLYLIFQGVLSSVDIFICIFMFICEMLVVTVEIDISTVTSKASLLAAVRSMFLKKD